MLIIDLEIPIPRNPPDEVKTPHSWIIAYEDYFEPDNSIEDF